MEQQASIKSEGRLRGDDARDLAETLLRKYFRTQDYPYTRHHIESYDQFLSQDLPAVIRADNPLTLLEGGQIGETGVYRLKAEIFIGGLKGDGIYIGTPTVSLKNGDEIRILFPNEARLRNLTYGSMVEADIYIRLTFTTPDPNGRGYSSEVVELNPADPTYSYLARFPLVNIPIMLHSRYCLLHGKPQLFLKEVGECVYDSGGYFIISGSEKVIITRQEQAFNTLYITKQPRDPDVAIYSAISSLNPVTRQVKRVAFTWKREENTLQVSLPFVRAPIPIFVLFRAMGLQSDQDIVRAIFPDPDSAEAKIMEPLLHESILEAFPFLDTYSAVNYMKVMTKGFSVYHVLDILHNQTFIHVEDRPGARIAYLAECVRRIMRVLVDIDAPTDRDDIRNQRCLSSGVLTRMLFQEAYTKWKKASILTMDKEYNFNESVYSGRNFENLFQAGTLKTIFKSGMMTESIARGFKGKWGTSGEDKEGVLQPLSRLSYMDFLSHCRRVVLDFDTGLKMPGPRRLHTSQFGYFCTNETPGGGSIGITKNLSILTSISTGTEPGPFIRWLLERGTVMACNQVTANTNAVPVFVNAGIVGYTLRPQTLRDVLKLMKWTGCLPASASISFSIRERRVLIFLDEGRPLRPLIHLDKGGKIPTAKLEATTWRELVIGNLPFTKERTIHQGGFVDPLVGEDIDEYVKALSPYIGAIEYVDPYESNEAYIAMFPDYIKPESSHLEIHPSTMLGLMTGVIPFPNHNQSPRNQLSCSQSKQGLSVYATNYPNRFDNMVHVLSYGEAPIVRTLYYDYVADGQMPYGQNLLVAIGCFTGYNQEDGIVFNADSFQRGMFRNMTFRSYQSYEENDPVTKTKTRIANPARVPSWTSLKPGVDYSKLDERGIIRVGEYVDETTVLVGRYIQTQKGDMQDASTSAQVWTRGRVEKIAVTTNNEGLALVKIRVIQDRVPELGDKFSTRHGQKGTIGMLVRAHDMPRCANGAVPDMIVNPHCMPSRMTMAQLLESLLGKAAPMLGAIGNATAFMNEGDPSEQIGKVLTNQLGMQPLGDDVMYDGMSGRMIPSTLFIGNIYIMRLKHMPEDKWNARAEGRKEQMTHQPTGGRGNQGGLRIGEMERDAILGHGIVDFTRESYMKRSDGYTTVLCNGCGTIPIYNMAKKLYVCPMCDGPIQFIGDSAMNLELLPPNKRSVATFSNIEIPYSMKLLQQEMGFSLNLGMRFLSDRDVRKLRGAPLAKLTADQQRAALKAPLPERIFPDTVIPERIEAKEEMDVRPEDLSAMGAVEPEARRPVNTRILNAAVEAAVNATMGATSTSPARMTSAAVTAAVNAAVAAANAVPGGDEAPRSQGTMMQPQGLMQFTSAQPMLQQPALEPLAEDDYEELGSEEGSQSQSQSQSPLQLQQRSQQQQVQQRSPQQQNNSVNVQTSQQPVLVVPLNMAPAPAAPAEYIAPPVPGAPPTFAIDTGDRAMNSMGLSSSRSGPSRPSSRSNSPRALPSNNKPSSTNANSAPNVRVNVVKEG